MSKPMNKPMRRRTPEVPSQGETDIAAVLKRIQQQLTFLERKVDTLISQSSEKPFKETRFSKPSRSFGKSSRSSKGKSEGGFREGSSDKKRFYEKPYSNQKRKVSKKRENGKNKRD